jgi:hypothetical protein
VGAWWTWSPGDRMSQFIETWRGWFRYHPVRASLRLLLILLVAVGIVSLTVTLFDHNILSGGFVA